MIHLGSNSAHPSPAAADLPRSQSLCEPAWMPIQIPPLPSLRLFEAAARHESFRKAAEELGLTASAVQSRGQFAREMAGRRTISAPAARRDADAGRPPSAALRLRGPVDDRARGAAAARTPGGAACRPERRPDLRTALSRSTAAAISGAASRHPPLHRHVAPAGAVSDGGRRSVDPDGQRGLARGQVRPLVSRTARPGGVAVLHRVGHPQWRDRLDEGDVSADLDGRVRLERMDRRHRRADRNRRRPAIRHDPARERGRGSRNRPFGNRTFFFSPEKALKSISSPLKNIKKIKPKVDRVSSHISLSTILKPLFPMINPTNISATTTGIIFNLNLCKIIGVKKAANITINKDVTDKPCSILFLPE